MTGFGAAEGPLGGGVLRVELKSVNHRYLVLSLKAPSEIAGWEAEIRERLRRDFERGHFTVSFRWLASAPAPEGLRFNLERARAVVARLRELEAGVGLSGGVTLDLVVRQPDVLSTRDDEVQPLAWVEIEKVLGEAVDHCRATRQAEGRVLATELASRLDLIRHQTAQVRILAPARAIKERDRLRSAVAELLDQRAVDESRLLQEIAFLAEKLDVTEELVRLDAHLAAADKALGGDRPVGKHLGFLAQELGREINTIGSKANDATMQHAVVEMKGELERFREQLENLE